VLAPSPSYWQWVVVLAPGTLALLVAAIVAVRLRRSTSTITLHHRMGSPSWHANESWSSNLTVGGYGLSSMFEAASHAKDSTPAAPQPPKRCAAARQGLEAAPPWALL
jgi:hypothetical protein